VARADTISRAALKAAGVPIKKSPDRKSWSKLCPKCKHQMPARRFVCDCGHQFAPVPASDGKGAIHEGSGTGGQKPR
jgi:hypothetical protein